MHRPKLRRRHFFIEAADPADDGVSNEQAHKGQSHHGGIHLGRRGARNQGEKRGPIIEEGNSQSSAVEEWPERMNRRGARKEDCQSQDQVAGRGKKGAGADLGQFVGLAIRNACCRQIQKSSGTLAMLKTELIDWNQGTGIRKPPRSSVTCC